MSTPSIDGGRRARHSSRSASPLVVQPFGRRAQKGRERRVQGILASRLIGECATQLHYILQSVFSSVRIAAAARLLSVDRPRAFPCCVAPIIRPSSPLASSQRQRSLPSPFNAARWSDDFREILILPEIPHWNEASPFYILLQFEYSCLAAPVLSASELL
jgi:hypothetical protein